MTESFLALNGVRVVSAHVSIPYYGTWTADVLVSVQDALAVGSKVTLTLGNLSLVGAVYRSGPFAGSSRLRIVGGGGGWMKQVTQQQYQLTGGVRLSLVLQDIASSIGEKVQIANDIVLGSSFVRESTQAGRILRQIAGPLWYVDTAGVTQVRPTRPASTVTSAFLINRFDGDRGEFEISTEDYASWQPGASFSNELVPAQTISLTTIDSDNSGTLRFTILTVGPPTDRLIDDIRALVREEVELLTFTGVYEYVVQATDGVTVDAQPTSPSVPLPSLRKVPLHVGLPGRAKPDVGTRVHVTFLNSQPVGAVVDSYEADSASPAAARVGDTVAAGYLVYNFTLASILYFAGTPAGLATATATAAAQVPPGVVLPMTDARITTGSSKVGIS